jgi:hypothetical protein
MRGGALLFLCSVGLVAGGACSARSLLTIELRADGLAAGTTLNRPVIDVIRTDTKTSVKTVDRSEGGAEESILILDDAKPLVVGVYLPSTFEGFVRVEATLRGDGCQWHGTSDDVDVHAGQKARVLVPMTPDKTCAPAPTPDGGVADAGDGGDDSAAGDAPPTLVSDGGDGPPQTLAMKCMNYCRAYADLCLTPGAPESFTCIARCQSAAWDDGTAHDGGENTFACRWDHLRPASDGTTLRCSECFAASPESTGICAPAVPDAGARDACPPTD